VGDILEPDFGSKAFRGDKRQAYLAHLRNGMGRKQAARASGVSIRTVQRFVNQNAEWEEDRDEAEAEAVEAVESALFDSATGGNVSAAIFFLTNRSPDRWVDKRRPNINIAAQAAAISGGEHQGVIDRMTARAEAILGEGTGNGKLGSDNVRELGDGAGDTTD
tara:strand:+ start:582 stop:1070 length:489 start_codon:yes stop_codon:yes gene_type:complete